MTVQRYRLTTMGRLGAALFVLPTPVSAAYTSIAMRESASDAGVRETLAHLGHFSPPPMPSVFVLVLLATLTLIGLVMVIVGREIVDA